MRNISSSFPDDPAAKESLTEDPEVTDAPHPLLSVRNLRVSDVRVSDGKRVLTELVHGVDLDVQESQIVALVAESGSGKSLTALSVLGLLPEGMRASGSIRLRGEELLDASRKSLRALRGAQLAFIGQDPFASLNPVFTIGFQLNEAVRAHRSSLSARQVRERARELLELVEVPDPERRLSQYPHQLSGGQCQRVGIAMALAARPALLVADEPTTALDVSVQAEIMSVLTRASRHDGMALLMITHDMGVVAQLADSIVVMHQGSLVEAGSTEQVLLHPKKPYTRALLDAVPRFSAKVSDTSRGGAQVREDGVLPRDIGQ